MLKYIRKLLGRDIIEKIKTIEWVDPEGKKHTKAYDIEFHKAEHLFKLASLQLERLRTLISIVDRIAILLLITYIFIMLNIWNVPTRILEALI